jgi:hypothetical protein
VKVRWDGWGKNASRALRFYTRDPPEALLPAELVALDERLGQLLVQGFGQRERERGVDDGQTAQDNQGQGLMSLGLQMRGAGVSG